MATLNDLKAAMARMSLVHDSLGNVLGQEQPELWASMQADFAELQATMDEMESGAAMLEERGFDKAAEEMRAGEWVDTEYKRMMGAVDDIFRWLFGVPYDEWRPGLVDDDEEQGAD